jgi:hypothetical protein
LWLHRITLGKLDPAVPVLLAPNLLKIITNTKLSTLEVTVIPDVKPGAAGRIEDGVHPCIEVDFDRVMGDSINICFETDVSTFVDIQNSPARFEWNSEGEPLGY